VLVASSAPLDQFVVRNPSYFFDAAPEHALINPDNLHILVDHVKCAAFELPFTTAEQYGRHDVQEVLGVLQESGFIHRADGEDGAEGIWQWTNESYPADAVSLRSISSDNFVVIDTTDGADVIGETSFTSGPSTLHEKAIYLVEGVLYQVEKLDFGGRKAYVRRIDCDYYTDAITYTKVTVLDTFATGTEVRVEPETMKTDAPHPQAEVESGSSRTSTASHGEVHVSSRVVGFKKIKFYTNENVGSGELDLPEQQMHTTAYWLTVPTTVMAALPFASDDRRDGVVGLSFAMRQIAQLLLMCDRQDIGISIGSGNEGDNPDLTRSGEPVTLSDEPRIFVYDNYPGGIGFSEPLFAMDEELRRRTHELIAGCECKNGCPTCVGPIGNTGPLAKTVALRILDLIGAHVPELPA
jgi:DEAD/DEAH box helicase domain-containing protein